MNATIAERGIGSAWEDTIAYASATYAVPVSLIKAIIAQESAWDPNAVNAADPSYGLMQINTRAHPEISPARALVPEFSITYGTAYLAQQLARYGIPQGISAYNAGHPIAGNSAYVAEVLAYQDWYLANDPASGALPVEVGASPDPFPAPGK